MEVLEQICFDFTFGIVICDEGHLEGKDDGFKEKVEYCNRVLSKMLYRKKEEFEFFERTESWLNQIEKN